MNDLTVVGITNGCGDDGWIFSLGRGYGFDVWVLGLGNDEKRGYFYGMELPRVGAFTDFRGSGYRNPVQILGENWENHVISGFRGLV